MDSENTAEIGYSDLSDELKSEVRERFWNSEYLVDEYFWRHPWDNIVADAANDGIAIDSESLEFDIYRNSFAFKGEIKTDDPFFQVTTAGLYFLDKNDLVEKELNIKNDSFVEDNVLTFSETFFDHAEEWIYGAELEFETAENLKIVVMTNDNLKNMDEFIKNHELKSSDVFNIFNKLESKISAAELFFSDEIQIGYPDEFMEIINAVYAEFDDRVLKADQELKDHYGKLLETIYTDTVATITADYEYYFSEEHADNQLQDVVYFVLLDKEGNQLEILDEL